MAAAQTVHSIKYTKSWNVCICDSVTNPNTNLSICATVIDSVTVGLKDEAVYDKVKQSCVHTKTASAQVWSS